MTLREIIQFGWLVLLAVAVAIVVVLLGAAIGGR